MPVVRIDMWSGRTPEQKKKLIEGITEVMENITGYKGTLHIIINDVSKENWDINGKPSTEI